MWKNRVNLLFISKHCEHSHFLNTIVLYLQGILFGQNRDHLNAVIVNSCILLRTPFQSGTLNLNASNDLCLCIC